MGQSFIRGFFSTTAAGNRIQELNSPNDIARDCDDLMDCLRKPQLKYEINCKITITILGNLQSMLARLLYKFPGFIKFQFTFVKDGITEQLILNLRQFYEFYEKVQHYYIVTTSQKIDMKRSRELIAMKNQETRPEEEEEAKGDFGGFKTLDEIPLSESTVIQTTKLSPGIQGSKLMKSLNEDDSHLCVLCFSKSIEMMLPCCHGFCESCCLDWYKNRGKSECPICRDAITQTEFETNIFIVMSKVQEQEINESIREELIDYLNSLCKTIQFS